MRSVCLLLFAVLIGCHPDVKPDPGPTPGPTPTIDGCAVMCKHLAPVQEGGLGCEEGQAVYDSDLPGTPGVPNESCADFCHKQETNGLSINTACVAQVQSCADIEAARQKTCN
jgi:hypothetical protein